MTLYDLFLRPILFSLPPETAHEAGTKRLDDTALSEAIDRALDDADGTPPRG